MNVYLGCPVWSYKGWVGSFFPAGTKPADFLREYARRLNTVEGNTTFYAVPAQKTIERWVEQTPETFRFCPKIPRTVSHAGNLQNHLGEGLHFLEVMEQMGTRLGPVFLQLPPRYGPALLDDLETFLAAWPGHAPLAVEVRHPDWFEKPHHENLNALLAAHRTARVVIDTRPIRGLSGDSILEGTVYQRMLAARERKPDLPVLPEKTGPFVFLRYIGHPQLDLNLPFVEAWADFLAERLKEGMAAYIFCHCPDEGLDPWLCRMFHEHIGARIPIAALPWDEADADIARQARLL